MVKKTTSLEKKARMKLKLGICTAIMAAVPKSATRVTNWSGQRICIVPWPCQRRHIVIIARPNSNLVNPQSPQRLQYCTHLAWTLSDTEEPVAKQHVPEKLLARVSKFTQHSQGNNIYSDARLCLEIEKSPEVPFKKGKEVLTATVF